MFVILLNLFHSASTPGPSSHTAVYSMGYLDYRGQVVPFSLKSEPQQPRFHWGWGRVEIVIYESSFVPEGHSKDADFVSKEELLTNKAASGQKMLL